MSELDMHLRAEERAAVTGLMCLLLGVAGPTERLREESA
jgi:hypothetical protein